MKNTFLDKKLLEKVAKINQLMVFLDNEFCY